MSNRARNLLCISMKNYAIIEFPYFPFKELNEEKAKISFDWFVSIIPVRLEILFSSIKFQDESIYKSLDYSSASLIPLAAWLSRHCHTMERDPTKRFAEIQSIKNIQLRADGEHIIPDWTWTPETLSLAYDVGIYLAKVFQKKSSKAVWTYFTKPKNHVYVNKPVLAGFDVPLSPSDLVRNCIARLSNQRENSYEELKKIHDYWERHQLT